jgi:diphosphomevalonate decarboxylase
MITWRCPSNIALVKYWGKHGMQLPMNPSISLTLNSSYTETSIEYCKIGASTDQITFEFLFEGVRKPSFEEKIAKYLHLVSLYLPSLRGNHLKISSHNSFPHSSGIASSASAMGALALCLCSAEKELGSDMCGFNNFFEKASFLARLGSGSASRSIYGGIVSWGYSEFIEKSSDEFANVLPFGIHTNFNNLHDAILLVSSKSKKVSSSIGHGLMYSNAYADVRYQQAKLHISELSEILRNGNEKEFITLVESEAMELHAMFMTSSPGYFLMEPDTIQILNKIRQFRESTGIMLCFTLDAGANVHLIYSEKHRESVLSFLEIELKQHCENGSWLDDKVGYGPERLR